MSDKEHWEELYRSNEYPWTFPDEMLVAAMNRHKPGKAIDLGAGEGGNSFWLAEKGWDVTSIDQSAAAVEFIRSESDKKGYSIKAEAGDVLSYTSEDTFDLVLIAYVHLAQQDRRLLFEKVAQLLSDHGILIYLGLYKEDSGLPEGARADEFPGSMLIADDMTRTDELVIVEQENIQQRLPIGHMEGFYEGVTAKVIAKKGSGMNEK
ncbi:class I SAM-dependent methyltransferase [Pontibacillus salicampi]|uniref:Class I SAM-dependent methyltransferase n=1 Tax=Pontibacillus salicampi TaxID=1449801 RepID=A0ABV6LTV5_9BACI